MTVHSTQDAYWSCLCCVATCMYKHVPPAHSSKGLQLFRTSEEGGGVTVTSLLPSGANPNFKDCVRELYMYGLNSPFF